MKSKNEVIEFQITLDDLYESLVNTFDKDDSILIYIRCKEDQSSVTRGKHLSLDDVSNILLDICKGIKHDHSKSYFIDLVLSGIRDKLLKEL